jgi:hypothetical protein
MSSKARPSEPGRKLILYVVAFPNLRKIPTNDESWRWPTSPDLGETPIVKPETSPDRRSRVAIAVDALQEARGMPPGAQRTGALKKAGLLRRAADSQVLIVRKKDRPRK